MRALVGRASAHGWDPALEGDVDDYENYLAIQLERLEDMDPAFLPEGEAGQRMMDGLAALLAVIGDLRDAAEAGALEARGPALLAAIDEADRRLGPSPR